jgi:ankyrin repeat protein
MIKNVFQKQALIVSILMILSACQSKTADTKELVEESMSMTTEKSNMSQRNELESDSTNTLESAEQSFSAGSLIQAVVDEDSVKVDTILQDKNYPIDEVNDKGETALLIATHENFIEIAKQLIDAGADINKQDYISDSPYLYAGAQGKTTILTYMLDKQEPDQQKFNRFGGNALIPAAEKGHLENVKLLLKDSRVDINHQNNYGYTALIEAVALRDGSLIYQQIVEVLLENGADKTLKDNTGRTAEDYAKSLGYFEMLKTLEKY